MPSLRSRCALIGQCGVSLTALAAGCLDASSPTDADARPSTDTTTSDARSLADVFDCQNVSRPDPDVPAGVEREVTVGGETRTEMSVGSADYPPPPDDARRAVEGVDAVITAVGSGPRDLLGSDEFVDGRGNLTLLAAAVDEGVEAFVMESALGVGDDPSSLLGTVFDAVIAPIQRAKSDAETAIRDAPVRPGILTDGPRTDWVQVGRPGAKLWGLLPGLTSRVCSSPHRGRPRRPTRRSRSSAPAAAVGGSGSPWTGDSPATERVPRSASPIRRTPAVDVWG